MPPARVKAVIFLILGSFFIFASSVSASTNLLQNPGFEELLFNWETTSGLDMGSNFTISSYVKNSGEHSALIRHNKTGSYGAQQIIRSIIGGNKYLGKGHIFFNNENAKNGRMRVAWYSSEDGSGSQMKTVDSNIIDTPLPSWQELDTGIIEAPTTAKSAKFRILLASTESGVESLVYFDDLSFEEITTTPTPSPSPSPTFISPPIKATYKINEAKDEEDNVLSSVKIYLDEAYLHHYAPETLTFCDGCQCDTYIDCGFGEHAIKLEKSGYENWEKTETISPGDSYEVNPVMNEEDSDSSSTSTPSPSPTLTPSPKPVEVTGATLLGKILGEEASPAGFYPWEATEEGKSQEATVSSNPSFIPKLFLGLGVIFLAVSGVCLWYNQRKQL